MKVSIIVPVYNRASTILQVVDSIINQSYSNWECILVDDNSTDNLLGELQPLLSLDNRFFYLNNRFSKGAQGARNTGILDAKGEVIVFLDSDDLLTKNSIETRLNFLIKHNVDIVYGDIDCSKFITESNQNNLKSIVFRNLALASFSALLVLKSVFVNNLLDLRFKAWQDDDFILSNIEKYKICNCSEVVAIFAAFPRANSITSNNDNLISGLQMILKKHRKNIIKYVGFKHLLICYLRLFILRFKYGNISSEIWKMRGLNYFFILIEKKVLSNFSKVYVR